MPLTRALLAAVLILAVLEPVLTFKPPARPLIVAHRGSPCALPEETLAGYEKAARDGADFLEMDVVSTGDGVLICRHDLTLDDSTDVIEHPEFAERKRSYVLSSGQNRTGFFARDFSWAELQTLFAKQAVPFRDQASAHRYRLASLDEVLSLVLRLRSEVGYIGVYIETKAPTFHTQQGLPLEQKLMQTLQHHGLDADPGISTILQSFEVEALLTMYRLMKELRWLFVIRFVWLLDCNAIVTDAQLDDFATYGFALGADKDAVEMMSWTPECGRDENVTCHTKDVSQRYCTGRLAGDMQASEGLVARAHRRNLYVHVYTLRNEARFMALDFDGDPGAEMSHIWENQQVDGFFTDCATTAVTWMHAQAWERYVKDENGSSFWSLKLSEKGAAAARYGVTLFVFCLGLFMVVWAGYIMKKYSRYERMEREQEWNRQAQTQTVQPNVELQQLHEMHTDERTHLQPAG